MGRSIDVAEFHRKFDRHPDDRLRLFAIIADWLPAERVLYPGSYVDIAPSVFYDDVTYVDIDRRAARFFGQKDDVNELVLAKRRSLGLRAGPQSITFHPADYRQHLPIEDESVDVLVSLYAGFISEHCTRYLRSGGHLVVNPSHGDVAMAELDPAYSLAAVIISSGDDYSIDDDRLERHLVPKRGHPPTADELHASGRGIAYAESPFAYIFRKR